MVEIPRDTKERLAKAYKKSIRGRLNRHRVKHTLWVSGDKYFDGYRVGDIIAIQPMNEEIIAHIKWRWWYFWRRAVPINLDIELTTDFNCKDVVVEARGFEAVVEGENYPIPRSGVKGLEAAYVQRSRNLTARVLKLSISDLAVDADIIPKAALRGDVGAAMSEISRYDEVPELREEEIQRRQRMALKQQSMGET